MLFSLWLHNCTILSLHILLEFTDINMKFYNYLGLKIIFPCVCSVMSSSLPTPEGARFLCPWNFPGKNTGMGCHFLLLIIRKMQIKTTMKYNLISVKLTITKKQQITRFGKGKGKPSCAVGGNIKWCNHYGKDYGDSSKN